MDIKNSLHVVRAAFTVSVAACKRPEYMAETLKSFPFLSEEERGRLGREYAHVIRQDGIWLGSVKTLPSQTRILARAARAALRGEEAWAMTASPRAVEILREEAVRAGLLPDPRAARLRDLDRRIEEALVDLLRARTAEEVEVLEEMIADLTAYRNELADLN